MHAARGPVEYLLLFLQLLALVLLLFLVKIIEKSLLFGAGVKKICPCMSRQIQTGI